MIEYDFLELNEYLDDFEIEYDKIYWENKCGWEHYLEYKVWHDMGPFECIGEEFCNNHHAQQYEYVGKEYSKIVYFHLGIDYHNFNGYFDNKYYGLHLFLENGKKKLWSTEYMKITKKPGVVLNRHLLINDILNYK